jgi:sugar-specific transcriptional regulator TrmB
MDWIFDEFLKWSAFPRMGEMKRYKIVPMSDKDIAEEEVKLLEEKITAKKKQIAELEEELQKQKKRLNP